MTGKPTLRDIPLRRLVPNVLTTVALCSGLASIHFVLKDPAEWKNALGAIGIAAVFDVLDGRAARMLRVTSRFGAVLD
jgi:CDP-diacylglycerol--serine O-phosphatidyltransferase